LRVAVADATQAIALVTEAAETDLPGMIADIRRRRPRHRRDRHRRHRPDEASGGVADVVAGPTRRWRR
jgi:hypothetical protein